MSSNLLWREPGQQEKLAAASPCIGRAAEFELPWALWNADTFVALTLSKTLGGDGLKLAASLQLSYAKSSCSPGVCVKACWPCEANSKGLPVEMLFIIQQQPYRQAVNEMCWAIMECGALNWASREETDSCCWALPVGAKDGTCMDTNVSTVDTINGP